MSEGSVDWVICCQENALFKQATQAPTGKAHVATGASLSSSKFIPHSVQVPFVCLSWTLPFTPSQDWFLDRVQPILTKALGIQSLRAPHVHYPQFSTEKAQSMQRVLQHTMLYKLLNGFFQNPDF